MDPAPLSQAVGLVVGLLACIPTEAGWRVRMLEIIPIIIIMLEILLMIIIMLEIIILYNELALDHIQRSK